MTYVLTESNDLTGQSASTLLDVDPVAFRECFDRKPFSIGHRLCDHPLFALDRLVHLAATLPVANIEYNAGDLPIGVDPTQTPRNGLSPEETVRRIAECKSWLVLKNVEADPEYRQLLENCLDEIRNHSEPLHPGMTKMQAFVFITSPGSVTPYHVDPEHNILLQIRGSKTVHLFDGRDRSVLSEQELERYYAGAHRNLVYRPEIADKANVFQLQPGQGLHFPVTHPHWVKNGDDVSISFSITFFTPDLDRRQGVHRVNAWLRARGLTPTPVEQSRWRDGVKSFAFRSLRRLRRLMRH